MKHHCINVTKAGACSLLWGYRVFPKSACLLVLCLLLCWQQRTCAQGPEVTLANDIVFMGEDVKVLSVASKRAEAALEAPAIAEAITHKQIRERGIETLGEALDMLPGFYLEHKEDGDEYYLRGAQDSALILFDTVPMGSRVLRRTGALGHGLSLASVKRIEVLRGPASVLWGPDAFAGVVNVVPMTGKDLKGMETGIYVGGPWQVQGGYVNWGHRTSTWDGFLSLSASRRKEDERSYNTERFWGPGPSPLPPSERLGSGEPDESRYLELAGNISFADQITLSARLFSNKRPYTLKSQQGVIWPETRETTGGFLKAEARRAMDLQQGFRFTGYIRFLDTSLDVLGRTLDEDETSSYAELIYDRSFESGMGTFTLGLSCRKDKVDDLATWDGFLPEFLAPANKVFQPFLTQTDTEARLWSIFAQYNRKKGPWRMWAGLRRDFSPDYQDRTTYNIGLSWHARPQWLIKLLYATSYRSPLALQLIKGKALSPEGMETLSSQINWLPSKRAQFSLGGFFNRIKQHVTADPYAGLSEPSSQRVWGMELEGQLQPCSSLTVAANLTLYAHHGPKERFRFLESIVLSPSGDLFRNYSYFEAPYDTGPRLLANLSATWHPTAALAAFFRLRYVSDHDIVFAKATAKTPFGARWIADMCATYHSDFMGGMDFKVKFNNLFDNNYSVPGRYSPMDEMPLSVVFSICKRW